MYLISVSNFLDHPRGRPAAPQVAGVPGPEQEPDRRNPSGHLPGDGQPQGPGLQCQRD